MDFCASKDYVKTDRSSKKLRTKMASSLYSHSLTGIVLIVTPDMSYNSNMGKGMLFQNSKIEAH